MTALHLDALVPIGRAQQFADTDFMPIKLPKGFQRRKSSGNALDEAPASGGSTFRVIERPNNKSFDGGALTRSAGGSTPSLPPKNSFERDDENLFRVSSSRPDAANRLVCVTCMADHS